MIGLMIFALIGFVVGVGFLVSAVRETRQKHQLKKSEDTTK